MNLMNFNKFNEFNEFNDFKGDFIATRFFEKAGHYNLLEIHQNSTRIHGKLKFVIFRSTRVQIGRFDNRSRDLDEIYPIKTIVRFRHNF